MSRKIIFTFLIVFIPFSFSFPQTNKIDFLFSNSIGYDFDKSTPTFYVNLSTEIDKGVFVGLRAGVYALDENIDDMIYDAIYPGYQSLPAGYYYRFIRFSKQTPAYIAGLYGTYSFHDKLSVNFSVGAKYYHDKIYTADVYFSKPTLNYPLQPIKIPINSNVSLDETKNIIKAYYSLGVDYHLSSFRLGVFADNIFSLGINIGKEF